MLFSDARKKAKELREKEAKKKKTTKKKVVKMKVTITPSQRNKYKRIGKSLIERGVITGFQLEDFNPKEKGVYYGHKSKVHFNALKKSAPGKTSKIYPRESQFEWNPGWDSSDCDVITEGGNWCKNKEKYVSIKGDSSKLNNFFMKRTLRGKPGALPKSWITPDIRFNKKQKFGKPLYWITKDIDNNSRFGTLVRSPEKMRKVKKVLKGEKVRTVYVQNYPGKYQKEHYGFYNWLKSIGG